MTVGGCAEEETPVALHAVWTIGVRQLEIPLIELILGAIGLKSHPGSFSVSTRREALPDFFAKATGRNDRLHGSTLS